MKLYATALVSLVVSTQAFAAELPNAALIAFEAVGNESWDEYLVDTASGSVSASGLLGISGESVTAIENVRDVVVAARGLSSNESKASFGLSITPARTSITPMDLHSYANSWVRRLLGSLTFSYAQGGASIEGADYDRKAFAIDTNAFFFREDDPVVATAIAYGSQECGILGPALPSQPPSGGLSAELPSTTSSAPPREGAIVPAVVTPGSAEVQAIKQRADACRERTLNSLRWNRSQVSVAYGAARINPEAGEGDERSMGRTLSASVIYGFDHLPATSTLLREVRQRLSLAVNYRKSWDEPVLRTLGLPQIIETDSSLTVMRLTGGSNSFRLLAEVSNAKARDITASQRAFKKALGVDVRIWENTWVNLRVGEQRTLSGNNTETGSLVSLSYSPTKLIN
ncbi:MAG TPA: hypothetical protein VNA21_15660 [Steroidobacteraceae bacterium]|nr:hypothetical protein [Steroidobacteraceae bacterium]